MTRCCSDRPPGIASLPTRWFKEKKRPGEREGIKERGGKMRERREREGGVSGERENERGRRGR